MRPVDQSGVLMNKSHMWSARSASDGCNLSDVHGGVYLTLCTFMYFYEVGGL